MSWSKQGACSKPRSWNHRRRIRGRLMWSKDQRMGAVMTAQGRTRVQLTRTPGPTYSKISTKSLKDHSQKHQRNHEISSGAMDSIHATKGHGDIHSRACIHGKCSYHGPQMNLEGFGPCKVYCKRLWNACRGDYCVYHLWDKRQHHTFPGHDENWQQRLRTINEEKVCSSVCGFENWEYCLRDGYE